jgi:serine protease inhibitor
MEASEERKQLNASLKSFGAQFLALEEVKSADYNICFSPYVALLAMSLDLHEVDNNPTYKQLITKFGAPDALLTLISEALFSFLTGEPLMANPRRKSAAVVKKAQVEESYALVEDYSELLKFQSQSGVSDQLDKYLRSVVVELTKAPADIMNEFVFSASFDHSFKSSKISKMNFAGVDVPVITSGGVFKVSTSDKYQSIELPLEGNRYSFIIAIPSSADSITPQLIEDVLQQRSQATEKHLKVYIPKFKFTNVAGLPSILTKLGLENPLGEVIDATKKQKEPSELIQNQLVNLISISLNESGFGDKKAHKSEIKKDKSKEKPSDKFKVDKPFYYVIVNNNTSNVLFVGKIVHPKH